MLTHVKTSRVELSKNPDPCDTCIWKFIFSLKEGSSPTHEEIKKELFNHNIYYDYRGPGQYFSSGPSIKIKGCLVYVTQTRGFDI